MVTHRAHADDETADLRHPPFRGVRLMLKTLGRVISLQMQLIFLNIRQTIVRFLVASLLMIAAIAMAVVAVIFLDIGLFRILTDVTGLPVVWASLIFAGVHLIAALVLLLAARRLFRKPTEVKTGGSHES